MISGSLFSILPSLSLIDSTDSGEIFSDHFLPIRKRMGKTWTPKWEQGTDPVSVYHEGN